MVFFATFVEEFTTSKNTLLKKRRVTPQLQRFWGHAVVFRKHTMRWSAIITGLEWRNASIKGRLIAD